MSVDFFNLKDLKELEKNIATLAEGYNLTTDDVFDILKQSLAQVLSEEEGCPISVDFTPNGIEIYCTISEHGVSKQIKLSPDRIKRYHIKKTLEQTLEDISLQESKELFAKYSKYRNTIVKGRILKKNADVFSIALEGIVDPKENNVYLIGLCHSRYMLKKDYEVCSNHLPLMFKVVNVQISEIDGISRMQFILSRSTKDMPVIMLRSLLQDQDLVLKCVYRASGIRSLIQTNKGISRHVLAILSQEFRGEKYQIMNISNKVVQISELQS